MQHLESAQACGITLYFPFKNDTLSSHTCFSIKTIGATGSKLLRWLRVDIQGYSGTCIRHHSEQWTITHTRSIHADAPTYVRSMTQHRSDNLLQQAFYISISALLLASVNQHYDCPITLEEMFLRKSNIQYTKHKLTFTLVQQTRPVGHGVA